MPDGILPDWIFPHEGIALSNGCGHNFDLSSMAVQIEAVCRQLDALDQAIPLGIIGDNSPAWVIADLALLASNRASVPIPPFFTPEQIAHLILSAGIQNVIHEGKVIPVASVFPFLNIQAIPGAPSLPPDTRKITFTSGTTGNPKGICLTRDQQLATAQGLAGILGELGVKRHLNLLPFSVLLENIAGIYVPLMLGAQCICPPLKEVGLSGSSHFDAEKCLDTIEKTQAESVILLPQMLQALVACIQSDTGSDQRLRSIKFMAVGGGASSIATLNRAHQLGLPVYEGYGLSECASVVSLNRPNANRPGSVGLPVPGVSVRLAGDNEIEVCGRGYAGILGEPPLTQSSWIKTGDLGAIDPDGFLTISGRKKNVLITSFGRNVSPEWPERMLMEGGLLAQVVVLGDGQASLNAVLVPRSEEVTRRDLASLIQHVNSQLPDYAQISEWQLSPTRFNIENGFATANGRLRRDAIARHFSTY
ncbi:MAG: AMP-binding protein [Sulfuricellaceae bacterium]|nr:AMP-binding protein [Sulfuricellaceae bacterium]